MIIAFVTSISGGVVWIDDRYAKADDQTKLSIRVDIQELRHQLRTALDEYYFLRKQSRAYPDDMDLKEKVDEAKTHVNDLKTMIKEKS